MGNSESSTSTIFVHVKTGDKIGAGTDATVRMKLYDTADRSTEELKLSRFWRNDHERGHIDVFPVPPTSVPTGFGEVVKLELWRDSFGFGDSWYLDLITVEDKVSNKSYHFPVQKWIKPNRRYLLKHYDTCLPQFEDDPRQRRLELEHKKTLYQYVVNSPGLPAQVKHLPEDEVFSDAYKWDIVSNKLQFLKDRKLISIVSGVKARWESWDDLRKIYKYTMVEPEGMKNWTNDLKFGIQRLQGCNPVLIRVCRKIPPNMPVDLARVESQLDGMTLKAALSKRRIFMVDLKILEKLPCSSNRTICAPIALFYLDNGRNLLPLAIQLFQEPSPTNPVFYPSDNPYTWTLVKMWYNNADASYHQSCTHLGFTHLLMEGVAVCTHRNLSSSHPVFKLLAPHFLFLLAINTRGLQKLINPGGWVDKTTAVGCVGMFNLIGRGISQWRLDRDGIPPIELATREVLDPNVLPWYPYRDDAVAIYDAIRDYVSSIINHFYDKPEKIKDDWELQAWAHELVLDKAAGGVGLQGVPGNGKFTKADEVVLALSAIICSCSVAHAAANFNQYDEYGFPPNYPAYLFGQVPTQKDGYTDKDIFLQLPPKSVTLDTMVVTRLLSSKGTNSLGDFEVQYLYDPVSVSAATVLRDKLKAISRNIQRRNEHPGTKFPYTVLDPQHVPNSISI